MFPACLCQRSADVAEHQVDRTRDLVHAGNGRQRDKANQKGLLDQILTFLTGRQVLKLHINRQK